MPLPYSKVNSVLTFPENNLNFSRKKSFESPLKSTIIGLLLEFNVFKTSTVFLVVAVVVSGIVTVGADIVGACVVGACVVGADVVETQSKSLQGQPAGQFSSKLQ